MTNSLWILQPMERKNHSKPPQFIRAGLKKSSYQTWTESRNELLYCWCAECQEHRYSRRKRIWCRNKSVRHQASPISRYSRIAICLRRTVTTANVTEREGALLALRMKKENLTTVVHVLAAGDYTGENFVPIHRNLVRKVQTALEKLREKNQQ